MCRRVTHGEIPGPARPSPQVARDCAILSGKAATAARCVACSYTLLYLPHLAWEWSGNVGIIPVASIRGKLDHIQLRAMSVHVELHSRDQSIVSGPVSIPRTKM